MHPTTGIDIDSRIYSLERGKSVQAYRDFMYAYTTTCTARAIFTENQTGYNRAHRLEIPRMISPCPIFAAIAILQLFQYEPDIPVLHASMIRYKSTIFTGVEMELKNCGNI